MLTPLHNLWKGRMLIFQANHLLAQTIDQSQNCNLKSHVNIKQRDLQKADRIQVYPLTKG